MAPSSGTSRLQAAWALFEYGPPGGQAGFLLDPPVLLGHLTQLLESEPGTDSMGSDISASLSIGNSS
ncbi:hypothetical protein BaRGS_00031315, partial [Batillaria attramentaria]